MNKGLVTILGVALALASQVNPFVGWGGRYSGGRTPGMPHGKHSRQSRPHAPNDGHWHMRFHRGRV